MKEAIIREDVVAEVMVVTKTAGVMGRQVIGPIVMLSLGGLKRRHLILLSQVIF